MKEIMTEGMQAVVKKIRSVRTLIEKIEDEMAEVVLEEAMKENYSEEAISECLRSRYP
jgi:hypothetical protein